MGWNCVGKGGPTRARPRGKGGGDYPRHSPKNILKYLTAITEGGGLIGLQYDVATKKEGADPGIQRQGLTFRGLGVLGFSLLRRTQRGVEKDR